MKNREFWAVAEDQEILSAETPDEAFQDYIENFDPPEKAGAKYYHAQPEKMIARQYRPMKFKFDPSDILENALEPLEEEYGDPGGDPFEPTEEMVAAAKIFCAVMAIQYTPWACEPTGEVVEVVTADWLKAEEE